MPLVVFLRGINVGGHRRFRPSLVARRLGAHEVVSVGAAGTFVVLRPGSHAKVRAAFRRILPFQTEVVVCDGREVLRLDAEEPFAGRPVRPEWVRFVSILSRAARRRPSLPMALPSERDWLVRVLGARRRFVFGVYRRQMKTIGCLGRLDEVFGTPATTRSWGTIVAIARILRANGRAQGVAGSAAESAALSAPRARR